MEIKSKKDEKIKLILEGLNCAACAAKIERYTNDIENVQGILNFTTKELTLNIQGNKDDAIKKVIKIVKELEPDVVVNIKKDLTPSIVKINNYSIIEEIKKPKNIQMIFGAVLFLGGILYNTVDIIGIPLFIAAYFLIGRDVVIKAIRNIFKGRVFDENFLMTIATIGAFIIGEYPEAVAVMLFYKVGEFAQEMAVNRSRNSIASLMDIRPDYANLIVLGIEKKVSPDKVNVGDTIIIRPGEKIPLDGIVIEGGGSVDTTALTGESIPRDVNESDRVLSGFINKTGLLKVKVEKEFSESTVSKILDLVENASNKKAKAENFITKFAKYYTPIVVGIAALLAIIPPVIFAEDFSTWIYRGL
ncbi:MAG: heavy metal translocating P-type ATPase, partial [Clostridium sp.]